MVKVNRESESCDPSDSNDLLDLPEMGTIFLKSDVIVMAQAILDDPILYSSSDYGEEYWCNFCGAEASVETTLKHNSICPVLIATDILTNNCDD